MTAWANAWRNVEGVMGDNWISRRPKGAHLVCCPGIHVRPRNDGSNGETTGESAGLLKHLDKRNRGSEESR